MTDPAGAIVCSGCGAPADPDDPYPFRCRHAGHDDVDHVMTRVLDPALARFPDDGEPNPFVRYRGLFHSYRLARSGGMSDDAYRKLVEGLDRAVAGVEGHGFTVTPFGRNEGLSDRLAFSAGGGVWVKDETGNVSGSHKGRHLMGLLIHLEVAERVGLVDPQVGRPELAIASCGNAALAAAVVARAVRRPLQVFVPTDADPDVVRRLKELDAQVVTCPREEGVAGDPTYLRLRAALADGALPFTCQGNENGLTIEGGETLGYEIVSDLRAAGGSLDRVFVQVGGGALASSCIQAFREAVELGALARSPRVHAVQTAGGFPLKRAYDGVVERIEGSDDAEGALAYAAHHRSEFMWPWEEEPRSIAHGILDDETYDWRAVVAGMIATGGHPVVVSEDLVKEANALAVESTGIDVDHTGSAGLAGLLALHRQGLVDEDERIAVLFTGIRR